MLTLYENHGSGNCYKVRLLFAQLGIPCQLVEMDVVSGATRTPDFLEINPNGRVPTLVFDDGRVLSESNAIIWHFAEGTRFLPEDAFVRAQVLQWMFFEQYSHEPFIAVARYWLQYLGGPPDSHTGLPDKHERGYQALEVMERHLVDQPYFAGGAYSVADIALYAYTHVADQGDFDLARYGAINAWLDRVRAQPGHITIDQ